jgi:hypothetical protein
VIQLYVQRRSKPVLEDIGIVLGVRVGMSMVWRMDDVLVNIHRILGSIPVFDFFVGSKLSGLAVCAIVMFVVFVGGLKGGAAGFKVVADFVR